MGIWQQAAQELRNAEVALSSLRSQLGSAKQRLERALNREGEAWTAVIKERDAATEKAVRTAVQEDPKP
jgi:hypothetical protein